MAQQIQTPRADYVEKLWDSVSDREIQNMLDEILGQQSFDFGAMVQDVICNGTPDSAMDLARQLWKGVCAGAAQEKNLFLSLIAVALIGAVLSGVSRVFQGTEVAKTAFYVVYLLFFSMLASSFLQIAQLAGQTLEQLLQFMKVLVPSFMISLSFSQGSAAAAAYYEFTLVMILAANWLLVGLALPAANLYFFLQMMNQIAPEDMFSKMAELIHDGVRLGVKTMFGVMMGCNVIQGLIVPVTAEVKNMSLLKLSGAIPGVGNSVSTTLQTVLCAGKLVKNAIGVVGVLAIFMICAVPLLQMVLERFLYQAAAALLQPVSDPRLIRGLGGAAKAADLYIYIVGAGAMLFIASIAVISAFTG